MSLRHVVPLALLVACHNVSGPASDSKSGSSGNSGNSGDTKSDTQEKEAEAEAPTQFSGTVLRSNDTDSGVADSSKAIRTLITLALHHQDDLTTRRRHRQARRRDPLSLVYAGGA